MKPRLKLTQINAEMLIELDNAKENVRDIALVFQSHVEFYIDEIIELLFETTKLRSIAFDKKMAVLKELGYISNDLGSDLKMLFEIRGHLAHVRKTHDLETKMKILTDLKKIKVVTSPKNDIIDEIRRFKPDMSESNLVKNFPETLKYVFRIFTFQTSAVYEMAYHTKTQKTSLKNMFKVD